MKCPACNYKRDWDDKKEQEKFIELDVNVTRHIEYQGERKVYLRACPKCNCVIIED